MRLKVVNVTCKGDDNNMLELEQGRRKVRGCRALCRGTKNAILESI